MLIVTIAALLMAASLAWFAYRLLQEEHRRSEARIAILSAALDADPVSPSTVQPQGAGRAWALPRTPLNTATNGATRPAVTHPVTPDIVLLEDDSRNMSAFRSEREPVARPVAPRADHADVLPVPPATRAAERAEPVAADVPTRDVGLFADVPAAQPADRRGLLAVTAIVLVGVLGAGYALVGRSTPPSATAAAAATAAPAAAAPGGAPAAGVPLELVGLAHTQERGTLVVRGRVRNPVAGSDRSVVAHVALLDGAGRVIGSTDAPLDGDRLLAGRDAPFVARAAVGPDVRRYRVTFRDATGAQVVHLDRRAAAR